MKKLLIVGAIFSSAFLSNAQISFGPIVGTGVQGINSYCVLDNSYTSGYVPSPPGGGYGSTYQNYKFNESSIVPSPKAGLSYKMGLQAKLDFSDNLAISAGIAYQTMSSQMDIAEESYNTTLNYLAVPLLVQLQHSLNDKVKVGIGIGPEINFLTGGQHKITSAEGSSYTKKIKAKLRVDESDDDVNNDEIRDNDVEYYRPRNISLIISPFVQVKMGKMNLLISPAYYLGLTNIFSPVKYFKYIRDETTDDYGNTDYTFSSKEVEVNNEVKTGGFGLNISLLFGGFGKGTDKNYK